MCLPREFFLTLRILFDKNIHRVEKQMQVSYLFICLFDFFFSFLLFFFFFILVAEIARQIL